MVDLTVLAVRWKQYLHAMFLCRKHGISGRLLARRLFEPITCERLPMESV